MEDSKKEVVTSATDSENDLGSELYKECIQVNEELFKYPLLVEETKEGLYARSLTTILQSMPYSNVGINGIFTSILYVLAVECGFYLTADSELTSRCFSNSDNYNCDIRRLRNIELLPYENWKNSDNKKLITLYLGSQKSFECHLYITALSKLLLINIYSVHLQGCYCEVFNPNDFIQTKGNSYHVKESTLKQLSDSCKNNLFVPLKMLILTEASLLNASIIGCNLDILLTITKYLDIRSVQQLSYTCSRLRSLLSDYIQKRTLNNKTNNCNKANEFS